MATKEKILAKREGNVEYYVKWKRCKKPTWEPVQNLANAQREIDLFDNVATCSEYTEENTEVTTSKKTYEVERILDKRYAEVEYLVKWKNYENTANTWEYKIYLKDKADIHLIRQFEEGHNRDELLIEDRHDIPHVEEVDEIVQDIPDYVERAGEEEVKDLKQKLKYANEDIRMKDAKIKELKLELGYLIPEKDAEIKKLRDLIPEKEEEIKQLNQRLSLARHQPEVISSKVFLCSCSPSTPCPVSCSCRKSNLLCSPNCGCSGDCSNSLNRIKTEIRPSTVQGSGCFALQEIQLNDIIGQYSGDILPIKLAERDPHNKYIARLDIRMQGRGKVGLVIDGTSSGSPVSRANTWYEKSNAEFVHNIRVRLEGNSNVGLALLVRATKVIRKNEEIFIDYGNTYPKENFL